MPKVLTIPESPTMKAISHNVSTGRGDSKKEREVEVTLPASLSDAVALEGERAVFRKYISFTMLQKQNEERYKLKDRVEKPRSRAGYLEQLDL